MFRRRFSLDLFGVEKRATPSAISIMPSGNFGGIDGNWSTFTVRIGNPAQNSDVLVSTLSADLWAVGNFACPSGANADTSCVASRGGDPQLFDSSASTTWSSQAAWSFAIDTNVGIPKGTGGNYGYDTVGLNSNGNSATVLDHQVVATISDTNIWLGEFGISPRKPNFDSNNTQPSFLTSLYNATKIPSLSYSFTAGAYYRGETNASLTFGGYDSSRFNDPGLYLSVGSDQFRDLVVGLQSIQYSDSTGSKQTLMTDGILAMVDSTISPLWLPQAACDNFQKAFGLGVNSLTQQYTVNDTQHNTNVKNNATVDFIIGSNIQGGSTTKISFPYAAFDMYYKNPTSSQDPYRIFPLRVAGQSSQYTLGRTFFQEAVVTVDYGRMNFTVAQALPVTSTTQSNIISITNSTTKASGNPPAPSTGSGNGGSDSGQFVNNSSGGGLSGGAIAGIVVGVVVGIAAVAAALWFFCLRKRLAKGKKEPELAVPAAAAGAHEKDGGESNHQPTHSPPPIYPGVGQDYFGKSATTNTPHQVNKNGTAVSPAITPAISEPAAGPVEAPGQPVPREQATINNLNWQQYDQGLHPSSAAGAAAVAAGVGPSSAVELHGSEAPAPHPSEMASPTWAHEMPSPDPASAELYSPAVSSGRISPLNSAVTPTHATNPTVIQGPTTTTTTTTTTNTRANPAGLSSNSTALAPAAAVAASAERAGPNHQSQRSSGALPADMQPTVVRDPMPENAPANVTAAQIAELADKRNTTLSAAETEGTFFHPSPDADLESSTGEYFGGGAADVSRTGSLATARATPMTVGRPQVVQHGRTPSGNELGRSAGVSPIKEEGKADDHVVTPP